MGRLSIYLPPFASDYTGVCSALFDLGALTVINDAGCCTNHYVFCDEPRWSSEVRPVFSSALRSIRAILGTDARLADEVCRAAEELSPELLALVGTPVPAITGMDMAGIACEAQARLKIPAFGFDTSGFAYYDKGIALAGRALIERFADPAPAVPVQRLVNILGMTPLDFGANGNDARLVRMLEEQGYEVGARLFMGLDIGQIRRIGQAEWNLAVSSSGVELAKLCKRLFGTPYRVISHLGRTETLGLGDAVEEAASRGGRILVVADQVVGNALRESLGAARGEDGGGAPAFCGAGEGGCGSGSVDVASFFGWHPQLASPGDVRLRDEASYLALLRSRAYAAIVADPLLYDVPQAAGLRKGAFCHPAVSGKLAWEQAPVLFR